MSTLVVRHGRTEWVKGRCRCDVCRADLLEYSRIRRAVAAVRAGRAPQVRVPARQARRNLTRLRLSGLSIREIAEMTGLGVGTLQHVQQRQRANVALTTETRLRQCRP